MNCLEAVLLRILIETSGAVAVKGVRQEKPTISIDIGLSQPQPRSNHALYHVSSHILLPHFKMDGVEFLASMPTDLRDALGDVDGFKREAKAIKYLNESSSDINFQ